MRVSIALAIAFILSSGQSFAAESQSQPPRYEFNIPAGDLSAALNKLARQTGADLVYRPEQVEGLKTIGVAGELTAKDAIARLLRGTALTLTTDDSGAMLIAAPLSEGRKPTAAVAPQGSIRLAQQSSAASASVGEEDARASDEAQDAAASKGIPEILVQGSRSLNMDIVRTKDDAQPYYIFDAEAIGQSGAVNVEDFLKRRLSMNTAAVSKSQIRNSESGNGSTINLRGLGPEQTLILINGRRAASAVYFSEQQQPNLNQIPIGMIERIETLPSSAAAIYGGNALGGVVNVVLKRDFEGGEIRASYDNTMDTNAAIVTVDGLYGASLEGGKAHFMVGFHHSDAEMPLARDREGVLNGAIQSIARNNPNLLYNSGAPFRTGATPNIASSNGVDLTFDDGTLLGSRFTYVPAGTASSIALAALQGALLGNSGLQNLNLPEAASRNFGLLQQIGAAPEDNSFYATARRRMSDSLELFGEFSYGRTVTSYPMQHWNERVWRIAGSAPTNPFLEDVSVTFALPDINPIETEQVTRRFIGGFVLDLSNDWKAAADYAAETVGLDFTGQEFAGDSFTAALNAGTVNPFVDTLAHPFDIDPYLGPVNGQTSGSTDSLTVRFSGPVWQMPGGRSRLTLGLQHRKEGYDDSYYTIRIAAFPQDGRNWYEFTPGRDQTADNAYAELLMPLVGEGNQRAGLRSLELQMAGRMEKYIVHAGTTSQVTRPGFPPPDPITNTTTDYSATNYTIGLVYKPVESVAVRGSVATGFLPPSFSQFHGRTSGTPFTVIDPRRGGETPTITQRLDGNPDLQPQSSESFDLGLIVEPPALPGLRFNAQWYRIEQEDRLTTLTAQQIIDLESQFPGRVTRDQAAPGDPFGVGAISFVDASTFNSNRAITEGVDVSIDYRLVTDGLGTFGFSVQSTEISHFKLQNEFDGPLLEMANQVNAGGPLKRRVNLSVDWNRDGWSAGWSASHYGSYLQTINNEAVLLAQGSASIPQQTFHDAFVGYKFDDPSGAGGLSARLLDGLAMQLAVRNVFNEAPAFDAFYPNSYYMSPFGDLRLRSYSFSFNKRF